MLILVTVLGCGTAGEAPPVDAGGLTDAAPDATGTDAGFAEDADSIEDVGTIADAGAAADAGHLLRTLSVIGGYGSGMFLPGTPVEVFADLAPADANRFERWAADGASAVGLRDEWHLRFTMPDQDLTLDAQRSPFSPEWMEGTYRGATDREKTWVALIPPTPTGLLLMLHGSGGSSDFIRRTEGAAFAIALAQRGWAVVSPEAEEVVAGDLDNNQRIRWDVRPNVDNLDFANLDQLVEDLLADGVVAPDAPRAVTGMSNGGAMSVSLGALGAVPALAAAFPRLTFVGAVSYCAAGRVGAVAASNTPTAWFMCARDMNENVGEAGNQRAAQNAADLADRGVRAVFAVHPPSRVYPERFVRVAGIDEATSATMVAELDALGAIDTQGFLQMTSLQIVTALQAAPATAPTLAQPPPGTGGGIRVQIDAMYADHTFFSDWAVRTHDFFEGR